MPRFSLLRDALCIVLLSGFIFLHGASSRPLTEASEGRVAMKAREALVDGQWVVPHMNGIPKLEKPPMSSWLVALSAKGAGRDDVAAFDAFLPPGLCAALLCMLLYWWLAARPLQYAVQGGTLGPDAGAERARAAGMLAAFLLATTSCIVTQGRLAEMDMLVALQTALLLWGWERWRAEGSRAGLLLAYAAIGTSVLTKGHVILVLTVPPLVVWYLLESRKQNAAEAAPPGKRPLWLHLVGVALVLLIVVPWAMPFLRDSGFSWNKFYEEGVARFDEQTGHRETWYWYLGQVPVWALPWFVLLPFTIWWDCVRQPGVGAARRRLWWLWFGVNFLIWSCVVAKQRHYVIPWVVPLALLNADALIRSWRTPQDAPDAKAAQALRGVFLLIGGLLAPALFLMVYKFPPADVAQKPAYYGLAAAGAVAFLAGIWLWLKPRAVSPFVAWWAGAACAIYVFTGTVEHQRLWTDSHVPFCERVHELVPEDAVLFDVGTPGEAGSVARPEELFYIRHLETPVQTLLPVLPPRKPDEPLLSHEEAEKLRFKRAVEGAKLMVRMEFMGRAAQGNPEQHPQPGYMLVTSDILEQLDKDSYELLLSEPKWGHSYGVSLIRGKPGAAHKDFPVLPPSD